HEAEDAEADAVSTMLRSPGGGTHRYFYDDRMDRVKVLQGRAQRLEAEARRHEDEARRSTGRVGGWRGRNSRGQGRPGLSVKRERFMLGRCAGPVVILGQVSSVMRSRMRDPISLWMGCTASSPSPAGLFNCQSS